MNEDGKFFHSEINFLIANDTIRCQDIILGTKWLRDHQASLNLDTVTTLSIRLRDKKGKLGKRTLSLEPEKSTFLLKDGGNDNVEVYSTKMIFNNATSGTLNFENNLIKPIDFAFDTINMVEWVDGAPSMTICGTTMEIPKYLLSNHKIGTLNS